MTACAIREEIIFMYRLVYVTLLIVLFSNCSKNELSSNNYIGTWELRSSNGMMGLRNYEPGNGDLMKLTKDSLYQYANGELVSADSYQLIRDTLYGYGNPRIADKLMPDNESVAIAYLEFSSDTLIRYVGIPAADGGSSRFVKIE